MDSRDSSQIPFLVDAPLEALLGAKLSTKRMIFLHFWYQHKQLHLNKASAVCETSKAVIKFWKEAGIKLKKIDCVIRDVNKCVLYHKGPKSVRLTMIDEQITPRASDLSN